jgi:hypothetical protein
MLLHLHRLESQGILQCGSQLATVPDVPEWIYDMILVEALRAPRLPFDAFESYIFEVMQSDSYVCVDENPLL